MMLVGFILMLVGYRNVIQIKITMVLNKIAVYQYVNQVDSNQIINC